jgi:hypothetical protein
MFWSIGSEVQRAKMVSQYLAYDTADISFEEVCSMLDNVSILPQHSSAELNILLMVIDAMVKSYDMDVYKLLSK